MGYFPSRSLGETSSSRERYLNNGTVSIMSENKKSLLPKDDLNRIILPTMPQDARNTLSGGGHLDVTVTYGEQNSWQFVLSEDDEDQSRYKIEGNSWEDILRTADVGINDNFGLRYVRLLTFEFTKLGNIIRIDDFNNNKLRFRKDDFNRDILPAMPQDARNTLSRGGRLHVTVTYGGQNSWPFVLSEDDQSRYKIEGNNWEDFLRTTDLGINANLQLRYIAGGGEDNPPTFELMKSGNTRIEEVSQ